MWPVLLLLIMAAIAAFILGDISLWMLANRVDHNQIQICELYVHVRDGEIQDHLVLIPLPRSCT